MVQVKEIQGAPKDAPKTSNAVYILNSIAFVSLFVYWFGFAAMAVMTLVAGTPFAIFVTLYMWLYPVWFVIPMIRYASRCSKRGEEKKAITIAAIPVIINCTYSILFQVITLPIKIALLFGG